MFKKMILVLFALFLLKFSVYGNNEGMTASYDPYSLKILDSRSTGIISNLPPEEISDTTAVLAAYIESGDYGYFNPYFLFGIDIDNMKKFPYCIVDTFQAQSYKISQRFVQLTPHTVYYYQPVVWISNENNTYYGDVDSFETNLNSVITENGSSKIEDMVSFYPNPFQKELNLLFHGIDAETIDISIYNLEGKLIKSMEKKNNRGNIFIEKWIPEKNIPTGVYFIKIKAGKSEYCRKVMLIR